MCRANDAMIKRTQDCRVNINIKEASSEALMEPFIFECRRMTLMVAAQALPVKKDNLFSTIGLQGNAAQLRLINTDQQTNAFQPCVLLWKT